MSKPSVAIVHDWMVSPGGGEKVVLALSEIWPEAPIYTSAYNPDKFPEFQGKDVRVTWLDKLPLAKKKQQLFTIPRAWAFKTLDLSAYDIVISSSSAESKYVKVGSGTLHVCYCHTPIRYYWSDYDWYRQNPPFGVLNPVASLALPALLPYLRRMDYKAAQRVSHFIANSHTVQDRIKKYYNRQSIVIFPPVDVDQFTPSKDVKDYFLIAGRQVAYKRLDLAVEAFNQLGLRLVVAGAGEEINRQRARAKSNIEFLGRVSDAKLQTLMAQTQALIFPQLEDFGIVPVEAMAAGRPVIAFSQGGVLDSVRDGATGVFFEEQTAESLIDAVKRFTQIKFNSSTIRRHAEAFNKERFQKQIMDYVDDRYKESKSNA